MYWSWLLLLRPLLLHTLPQRQLAEAWLLALQLLLLLLLVLRRRCRLRWLLLVVLRLRLALAGELFLEPGKRHVLLLLHRRCACLHWLRPLLLRGCW